jgi:predicted metal-dependent phosphoesterase TrpH
VSGEPHNPEPLSPRVDLHAHSLYSDGEHAPAEVARMARQAGVTALALTDHDCLDGLAEFVRAAEGFEPVSGVEVSARRNHSDVHLVGLFVDPGDERLRRRLKDLAETRAERTRAMLTRLRAAGIHISEAEVMRFSSRGTVGRPHLAMALVAARAVQSVEDAFRKYLRPGTPGYVPKPGPSPEEAVAWIHEAGGAAVLAHPGPMHHDEWIAEIARAGLDGIEVWHPKHNPHQQEVYRRLAAELDLVPSGGSDYHGASVGDALIGQEPVPEETVERLRRRCLHR